MTTPIPWAAVAGTERCTLTDLPPGMCSHCRKIPEPEPERRDLGRPFAAAYPGRCVDCDEPFDAGDRIRADGEGGYLGPCCAEEG